MGNLPLNLITFPAWWYTNGLKYAWQWAAMQYRYGLKKTGLVLFVKHLGEPIYGDYSRFGKIFGIIFRLIMVALKLLFLAARLLFVTVTLALFIVALPAVVALIVYQFIPF